MNNRVYWIILISVLVVIITVASAASALLPPFLAPFVLLVYAFLILYMAR